MSARRPEDHHHRRAGPLPASTRRRHRAANPGRPARVDGTVSAETTLYDFNATFHVTYEMVLDDIPRDPDGHETRRADLETIESLEQALRAAGDQKRTGQLSTEDYEAEVKRVHERLDDLPKPWVCDRPRIRPRPRSTPTSA